MPFERIVSLKNERIKKIVALRERKARDQEGWTVIDGLRELQMAAKAGIDVNEFYFCPDLIDKNILSSLLNDMDQKKVRVVEVTPSIFEKINFGDRNEGITAVVRQPQKKWDDIQLNRAPLLVIVEAVEKPGNLGAILRTCDAAGVDGLIVCDARTDVYNPNVIRASLGAVFTVPVVVSANQEALNFLRRNAIQTVGTFPDAKGSYWQTDMTKPAAVLLGSEQNGLSEFWHKNADERIRVPMQGDVNSLNVSITAALVIYESVRQRH